MAGKMEKRRPRETNKVLLKSIPMLNGFHAKQREHPKQPMPIRAPKR